MLLDFDEHRLHRRALSVAFKSGPMKSYLSELDDGILERVTRWRQTPGPMLFYPAMKQLTLDLAATSFLGAGIGPEVDEITRAFVDMVAASVTPIRRPWPGTQMARGVKGRKRIVAYFSEQIPIRRTRGGEDLFSQLCRATHEDGALLSTQDIIDHMSFLMMAAHDTLTSSLTSFVGAVAPPIPSGKSGCATRYRRSASPPARRRLSTISKPCRSPRWRSRKRCGSSRRFLDAAPRDARLQF